MFTALIAMLALAFTTSAATALRSVEVGGRRRITATAALVNFESEELAGITLRCNLTLEGEVNGTIAKRRGATVGTIERAPTGATRETCFESVFRGQIRARVLVPITVVYESILGTLPNITGILLIGREAGFLLSVPGIFECLFKGDVGVLVSVERGGETERITFLPRAVPLEPLGELTGGCPRRGKLSGSGTITRFRVRLL